MQSILKKLHFKGRAPAGVLHAPVEAAAWAKALDKGAAINRDPLHARLRELGWEGVSLVALDDDWSAMRFKRIQI